MAQLKYLHDPIANYTLQKMKFSIKSFFSKCDQDRSFLRIWSYLLKKSCMENFIFCAVLLYQFNPFWPSSHFIPPLNIDRKWMKSVIYFAKTHSSQQSGCFTALMNIIALRKTLFLSEYFEKININTKKTLICLFQDSHKIFLL